MPTIGPRRLAETRGGRTANSLARLGSGRTKTLKSTICPCLFTRTRAMASSSISRTHARKENDPISPRAVDVDASPSSAARP